VTYQESAIEFTDDAPVIWFTGMSSAGKSTLCLHLREKLAGAGYRVEWLDGDEFRRILSTDLVFSRQDRDEQVKRIGHVARWLSAHGAIVLVSAISPYRATRDRLRRTIPKFVEVYVNAPLEICEERDVKGLYKKARAGEISSFTGVDSPYEAPEEAEIECRTGTQTVDESMSAVLGFLELKYSIRLPNPSTGLGQKG
jgi:adenylylsulfate kinase